MLSPRRRLAAVRRTGTDAGITLVELLVTMVLMTVVSGLALNWLIGENSTDTTTQNSTFAQGSARAVLQSWPALLRVADSPSNGYATAAASGSPSPTLTTASPGTDAGRFLSITSNSITFNADVANAPSGTCGGTCARGNTTQVTLTLTAGGAMTQQLVQQGSPTKSITLVPNGAALASGRSCLFTTLDANGNALGCNSSTPLGAIAQVTLAFALTPAQGGAAQTYQSSTAVTGTLTPIVSPAAPSTGASQ